MNWIGILLLVIHTAACIALILIVLLQAGKGASLGAAFGGGASQTVFGSRSATFMGRITWVLAGVFMLTSLLLTMISPWGPKGLSAEPTGMQQETTALPPLGEEAVPAPVPQDLAPSAQPEAATSAPETSSAPTGMPATTDVGESQPAPAEAPAHGEPTPPAPTTPDS